MERSLATSCILPTEETVPVRDLPAAISGPISKQYPKAPIQSTEKRVHGEAVEYIRKLKGAAVKKVVVNAEGKIICTK
jgi:hypothetical protein